MELATPWNVLRGRRGSGSDIDAMTRRLAGGTVGCLTDLAGGTFLPGRRLLPIRGNLFARPVRRSGDDHPAGCLLEHVCRDLPEFPGLAAGHATEDPAAPDR